MTPKKTHLQKPNTDLRHSNTVDLFGSEVAAPPSTGHFGAFLTSNANEGDVLVALGYGIPARDVWRQFRTGLADGLVSNSNFMGVDVPTRFVTLMQTLQNTFIQDPGYDAAYNLAGPDTSGALSIGKLFLADSPRTEALAAVIYADELKVGSQMGFSSGEIDQLNANLDAIYAGTIKGVFGN